MISISINDKNQNEISIYFDKERLENKIKVMRLISDIVFQFAPIEYYIMIKGLGATIETMLEKVKSEKYIFIDKFRYKFIVKELPELHLVTENAEDYLRFSEFIESFNEGEVAVTFLAKSNADGFCEYTDKRNFIEYAKKYAILDISIHSDGEVFDIRKYKNNNSLILICNCICEMFLEKP